MAVTARKNPNLEVATCQTTDAVQDCVVISGPKVGGLRPVTKVDPTDVASEQAVGIITKKYDSTTCEVQLFGPMIGVYSSLTPGKRYWVDGNARLTETRPSPSVGGTFNLQLMGVALASDELMVNPHMPTVLTK